VRRNETARTTEEVEKRFAKLSRPIDPTGCINHFQQAEFASA
jgi:hypothetical protein